MSDTSSSTVAKQKEKQKEYMRQWYQTNKEQRKERALLYYYANHSTMKERNNATAKAYYWKNRETILAKRRCNLAKSTKVYPRSHGRVSHTGCSPPIHERENPFRLDFSR